MQVIRNSQQELKDNYQNSNRVKDEVDYNQRSELYRVSLRSFRSRLHSSAKEDRELLTKALQTWSDIKDIRDSQGYTVTPSNLLISKMEVKKIVQQSVISIFRITSSITK